MYLKLYILFIYGCNNYNHNNNIPIHHNSSILNFLLWLITGFAILFFIFNLNTITPILIKYKTIQNVKKYIK
ncbi:hypothetical protein YYG_01151 [Plasmodium vinckei petteri]|uniref:Uncharacterized protein n=1 Tax=Plasmodium vinckei petteri TaxID=138298 RepID=W7B5B5_PLAVN|nr:hypothetical protein YYG_01151 [Plasmodium vinckei petteri]